MTSRAEASLRRLWELLDQQRWDHLGEVLDAQVRVSYPHSGETLDHDGFVRLNREYPGRWHCAVEETIGTGDRVGARVRISDGSETYYAASFATVRGGMIIDLFEVWTSAVAPPPADRRPI